MKKKLMIVEGIIAAIAVLAVVIVCLLPEPGNDAETTEEPVAETTERHDEPSRVSTEAPSAETSATESLSGDPSETDPPVTDPPATDPPATEPPATEPPATNPPVTESPATEPPETDPPIVPSETSFTPAADLSSVDYSRIVFVGDSRTKTMGTGGTYEFRMVPNDSISATWGGTLYDGRAQQDVTDAIFKKKPIMVFWYGINDVQMHPERDNVDVFIQNYDRLLSLTANNPGCKVYVLSILTTTVRERDYYEGQNENIRRYNEALSQYCAAHGYVYVDISSLLTGDECFYPGDNIHFSEAWYRDRFLPTVLRRVGLLQ